MRIHPLLLATAWLVAATLIFVPALETVATVWPLRMSDSNWRFGAAGLLSRGVPLLLVGVLLAVGLSLLSGSRRVLLTMSAATALAGALVLAGSALFVLDMMSARAAVNPDMRRVFDVTAVMALLKMGVAGLCLVGAGLGTWRSAGKARERGGRRTGTLISTAAGSG